MKNIGKSVRNKLYNISKANSLSFQHLIIRYLHERLLYRISASRFNSNFYLKGGTLLYMFSKGNMWRYTMDIDFSLHHIEYNQQKIVDAFKDICTLQTNDGVVFDAKSISSGFIRENDMYGGIRVFIQSNLDTIKQRLQIDLGYGDAVFPKPTQINYPVILDNLEIPLIFAYSVETVIAEKFHAMIELAEMNSRMKDFYDVYHLLMSEEYNPSMLEAAIKATFKQRKTGYTENHELFTNEFAENAMRVRQWKAFLKKINQPEAFAFANVIGEITSRLQPIWLSLSEENA
jgi:predicted nucleotidyltransferase component of viral defense system